MPGQGARAPDGKHRITDRCRLLVVHAARLAERCDVAVGSRFVSGEGYPAYRYRSSLARRFDTALLRRSLGLVLTVTGTIVLGWLGRRRLRS